MALDYLLDTNAIIDFSSGRFPTIAQEKLADIINNSPTISVITKIELLCFSNVPDSIVLFTEMANVIGLNDEIVSQTIIIRKKYKIKLPDAIIAATALVFNLKLVTNNVGDLKKISELQIVNPYQI